MKFDSPLGRTLTALALCTLSLTLSSTMLVAQSGGFIATLGTDTVHLERFTFENGMYRGTIVTRVPQTRVVKYTLTPASEGRIANYTVETFDANGSPIRSNGAAGSLHFANDSIVRVTLKDGSMDTTRMRATHGAVPGPSLPYVGVTYLSYELAFQRMKALSDTVIFQVSMIPQITRVSSTNAWLVGSDSAELSYFGVAKSGYRFNSKGELTSADWRNTTYRYRIERIPAPDIDSKIRQWAEADRKGAGIGALSPRDTVRASFNAADFVLDYSRPAKRGRDVWGTVVSAGQVWRLGADVATHFTTSRDIRLGNADIPAGTYTLWMLPAANGTAELIVNKQVRIFGTQYNRANDLVRIPLERSTTSAVAERLTLGVDNGRLSIWWDKTAWRVPITVK